MVEQILAYISHGIQTRYVFTKLGWCTECTFRGYSHVLSWKIDYNSDKIKNKSKLQSNNFCLVTFICKNFQNDRKMHLCIRSMGETGSTRVGLLLPVLKDLHLEQKRSVCLV